MKFQKFILLILLLLTAAPHPRAEATPEFKTRLSSESIVLHDKVTLQIEIKWPKIEGAYQFNKPSPNSIHLSLIRVGESQENFSVSGKEWIQKTLNYEFEATEEGEGSIYPFSVTYYAGEPTEDGAAPYSLNIQGQKIQIRSIPWTKIHNLPRMIFTTFAFLISATLAVFGFQSYRKKTKPLPPPSENLLQDQYLTKLNTILKDMTSKGRKEILYDLGVEFRGFLADHYSINSRLTDSEILNLLTEQNISREEIFQLKEIFETLDHVRYAGKEISVFDFDKTQSQMKRFIESKKVTASQKI